MILIYSGGAIAVSISLLIGTTKILYRPFKDAIRILIDVIHPLMSWFDIYGMYKSRVQCSCVLGFIKFGIHMWKNVHKTEKKIKNAKQKKNY